MNRTLTMPPELAALIVGAMLLRLAVYFLVPNVQWLDEIYQVMEPAHRLIFGTGAVSWEWVLGIRSWLFPGIVAALMEIGRALGSSPASINFPLALFLVAASCAPIVCAYRWGRRLYDRTGGFVAAGMCAVWVDLVYMASHALTEVIATDSFIVALYCGYPERWSAARPLSRRRLFIAGAMLGLTFAFRFHLALALLVAAIGICGIRRGVAPWASVIAGASLPIVALAILDWVTLGAALQSVWLNFWVNAALPISSEAGTGSPVAAFILPLYLWGGGAALVIAMALVGARKLPLLAYVALAVFITHAIIPHKEYRFLYPGLALLVVLAGIGTAATLRLVREARPNLFSSAQLPAALALIFWSVTSLAIAASPLFREPWTRETAQLEAFDFVSHQPDSCGVGLYGVYWVVTPGQSWLPPRTRLYQTSAARLPAESPAFNYILARRKAPPDNPNYRRLACFDGDRSESGQWQIRLCVWHREDGCTASAAPDIPVNWPRAFSHRAPEFSGEPPGFADEKNDDDAE